jgi:hypothetical protein
LTTVRPALSFGSAEVLQLGAEHRGLPQRVGGKTGRRWPRWGIDQGDAGRQRSHDRHLLERQRSVARCHCGVGVRRDQGFRLDRHAFLPIALVITLEQPPSRLAIKHNEDFALPALEGRTAKIGGAGDHPRPGRSRQKVELLVARAAAQQAKP